MVPIMEDAVLRALVDCLDFIENSPDDVIDPDAAVRALENVSYELQALPADAQVALSRRILALADDASDRRASFVRSLPEAIGLAS
jgi:hypothetical protein